jgi:hypothetical protein
MGRCWDGLFRVLTEKPPYPKQGNLTQCWPDQRSIFEVSMILDQDRRTNLCLEQIAVNPDTFAGLLS